MREFKPTTTEENFDSQIPYPYYRLPHFHHTPIPPTPPSILKKTVVTNVIFADLSNETPFPAAMILEKFAYITPLFVSFNDSSFLIKDETGTSVQQQQWGQWEQQVPHRWVWSQVSLLCCPSAPLEEDQNIPLSGLTVKRAVPVWIAKMHQLAYFVYMLIHTHTHSHIPHIWQQ